MSRKTNLIILAEDNPGQREMFTKALEQQGYEVRAHPDGAPALAEIEGLSAEDRTRAIVVSDVTMSGMNGIALSRAVREKFPQMPVMLWSDVTSGATLRQWQEDSGAHFVASKSFNPGMMQLLIDEALAACQPAAGSPAQGGESRSGRGKRRGGGRGGRA